VTTLRQLQGDISEAHYFPGHATAGTAIEVGLFRARFRCTVTAVEFIPSAAITGDNTNNFILNVRNRTTGAGTAVPATLTFATAVNGVANTPKVLTLSGTAAALVLAEGDVVTAEKAITASGLVCPPGLIVVHLLSS
jgi:hypothetical protein